MHSTEPYEIEKKFLVKSNDWKKSVSSSFNIKQGYLKDENNKTIRIRIVDDTKAIFTSKGKPVCENNILVRTEVEEDIPLKLGILLITQCDKIILKRRNLVPYANHVFEVDEFLNLNTKTQLIMAELELNSTEDEILLPSWIGADVTSDNSYSNTELIKKAIQPTKKDFKKSKP